MQKVQFNEVAGLYRGCPVQTNRGEILTLNSVDENNHYTFKDKEGCSTHVNKWVPLLRRINSITDAEAIEHANMAFEAYLNQPITDKWKVTISREKEINTIYVEIAREKEKFTLTISDNGLFFEDKLSEACYIKQHLHTVKLCAKYFDVFGLIDSRQALEGDESEFFKQQN